MIPTTYAVLKKSVEPFTREIFFADKKLTSCKTGLKYPIKFGISVDDRNIPLLQVSNLKHWVPWGMTACNDSFLVSISKKPMILVPNTCKIDNRNVKRVFQWIVKNLDKLLLIHWMFLNGIYSFKDETGVVYTQDSILSSMRPVKRKVGVK
jgi:hypothetical protein